MLAKEPAIVILGLMWLLLAIGTVASSYLTGQYTKAMWDGISVELHGIVIDAFVIGLLAVCLIKRAESRRWKVPESLIYADLFNTGHGVLRAITPDDTSPRKLTVIMFGESACFSSLDVSNVGSSIAALNYFDELTRNREYSEGTFRTTLADQRCDLLARKADIDRAFTLASASAGNPLDAELVARSLKLDRELREVTALDLEDDAKLENYGIKLAMLADAAAELCQCLRRRSDECISEAEYTNRLHNTICAPKP